MNYWTPLICLLAFASAAMAAEPPTADELREGFNRKYKDYLTPGSQALLPFPKLEKMGWKKLQESQSPRKMYTEPAKYYNNKVYSFTLYRVDGDGSYYLDAIGGFWGMDELVYGPIPEQELH